MNPELPSDFMVTYFLINLKETSFCIKGSLNFEANRFWVKMKVYEKVYGEFRKLLYNKLGLKTQNQAPK